MTGNQKTTITFALEKETKGAVRYQETDASGEPVTIENGAKVGTLYVRKTALNGIVPNKMTMVLSSN